MGRKKKTTGTFDDWFSNYSQQNGIDISGAYGSGTSYSQNNTQPTQRKKATFDDWFTNYKTENNIDLTQQRQETPSYTQPSYRPTYLPTNQQAPKYTQNPLVQAAQNKVSANNGYVTGSASGDKQYQRYLQQMEQQVKGSLYRQNLNNPEARAKEKEISDIQNQLMNMGKSGATNIGEYTRINNQLAEKQRELGTIRSNLTSELPNFSAKQAYYDSMDDATLEAYRNRIHQETEDLKKQGAAVDKKDWDKMLEYGKDISASTEEEEYVQKLLDSRNWNNQYQNYMNLRNEKGFDGSYQSTYRDNGQYVDPRGNLNGVGEYIQTEMGKYGDITYDYLNNDPNAMQVMQTMNPYGFRTGNGEINSYYAWLNEDEKEVFNHLYKQSPEKAYEFMDFMADELERRERVNNEEYMSALAEKSPVGASMLSVSTALGSPIAVASDIASAVKTGEFNTNAWANQFSYVPKAIRETVSNNIAANSPFGQAGSFLYNTGMSMADNMAQMFITGGMSQASILALMGNQVFANAVTDGVAEGKSTEEILADAFIQSGIEVLTEKIGLDEVFEYMGGNRTFAQLMKSAGAEGSEEALSDILNWGMDGVRQITTGRQSEMQEMYNAYRLQGFSRSEALARTISDMAKQAGADALGGALSGFAMAGGGAAITDVTNGFQYRKIGQDVKESLPENSQYRKMSDKKLGRFVSDLSATEAAESEAADILREAASTMNESGYADYNSVQNVLDNENAVQMLEDSTAVKEIKNGGDVQAALRQYAEKSAALNALETATSPASTQETQSEQTEAKTEETVESLPEKESVLNPKLGESFEAISYPNKPMSVAESDRAAAQKQEEQFKKYERERSAGVYANNYNDSLDFAKYTEAMQQVSDAGFKGDPLPTTDLPSRLALDMYEAGVKDRQNSEVKNGRTEVSISGERGRNDVQNSGRQGGSLAQETGRTKKKWSVTRYGRTEDLSRLAYERSAVSSLDLGIKRGTASKNLYVVTSGFNQSEQGVNDLVKAMGAEITPVLGNNLKNLNGTEARAAVFESDGKYKIVARMDHPAFRYENLSMHEIFHLAINKEVDSGKNRDDVVNGIYNDLANRFDDNALDRVLKAYSDIYSGAGMTESEIKEELLCDMMGGMNVFELNSDNQTIQAVQKLGSVLASFRKVYAEGHQYLKSQLAKSIMDGMGLTDTISQNSGQVFESRETKYSLDPFSKEMLKNLSNSKRILIYQNEAQLVAFVNKALTDGSYTKKMYFGKVGTDLSNRIYLDTGYDFEGKNVSLRADNIRKTRKDHGDERSENLRGQSAIVPEDYKHIPDIIGEPDTITKTEYYGKPAAEFKKIIDGRRFTALFVDSGKSTLELYVQTMYKGNKKSIARTSNATALNQTPATPTGAASNDYISHLSENDKSEFDMKMSMEVVGDLIAVHNIFTNDIGKALDLGGFPMPSIAITKAEMGHANFGDVSLVFGKETIDPERSVNNKVYSGDAWTPTFPTVDLELNEKMAAGIYSRANKVGQGIPFFNPVDLHPDNLERALQRAGSEAELIDSFKNDYGMKQMFLSETGKGTVPYVTKEREGTRLSDSDISLAEFMIDTLDRDTVLDIPTRSYRLNNFLETHKEEIANAYEAYINEGNSNESIDSLFNSESTPKRNVAVFKISNILQRYISGDAGPEIENDIHATEENIDKKIDTEEFSAWLEEMLKGINPSIGFRNNMDPFTPSGNRRKWSALHMEVNLENAVKSMRSQEMQKGAGFLGMGNPTAAATREFRSIKEIKRHSSQLQTLPEEEYESIRRGFTERFNGIVERFNNNPDQFGSLMDTGTVLCEDIATSQTKQQLGRKLKSETVYGYKYSESLVDDLWDLVEDIRNMPTGYFEAKPRRAVTFDEVRAAVVPNTIDDNLLQRMTDAGVKNVVQYKADDEADRLAKLNSLENVRFSRELGKDFTIIGESARWTDERIDSLIHDYGASNPDYSQAYAALINPRDYLKLTLSDDMLDRWNRGSNMPEHPETYSLDEERLRENTQTPFLSIYSKDGTEVQGHEGRHRMRALLEAGITSVPVVIRDTDTKYSKQTLDSMTLTSQDFGEGPVNNGAEITLTNLVPIKETNRDELTRLFGGNADVRFSRELGEDINNQNLTESQDIRYSRIIDKSLLRELNNEETITVYRAMQEIDGKLYPPMAARVADEAGGKRSLVEPTELGVWYQADERPDLIKNGKFTLDKANGSSLDAAYNPYWHTSRSLLNDQFSSAYKRPNLVTVECEVPVTELTSGYKAEGAKDAVGEMYWHSGPVSSKLAKVGNPRRVILSRYVKVNRIVPDSEAAATIAGMLKGTDIKIPGNVVTPSLRNELEKYGVMDSSARFSQEITWEGATSSEYDRLAEQYSYLEGQYKDLQKENKKNAERYKYFKGETKLTKNPQVDIKDAQKVVDRLTKEFDSVGVNKDDLAKKVQAIATDLKTGKKSFSEITDDVIPIANEIVRSAKILVPTTEEEIVKHIRDTKIRVSDKIRRDIADYNGWRRSYFGRITFSLSDGMPVEDLYNELRAAYGNSLFPPEINNPTDQLMHITDIVDNFAPQLIGAFGDFELAEATESVAFDMLQEIMETDIHKTFADKKAEQIENIRKKDAKARAEAVQKVRTEKNEQIERIRKENTAHAKELVKKVRDNKNNKIKEIRQHYKDVAQDRRIRRAEAYDRNLLLKTAQRLDRMKTTKANRMLIEELIGDLDLVAVHLTGSQEYTKAGDPAKPGMKQRLEVLKAWYEQQRQIDPDFIPDPYIEDAISRLEKKQIADLDIEDVRDLTRILRNIENEIRTHNKLIDSEDRRDIYIQGVETMEHIYASAAKGRGVLGTLDDLLIAGTLSPERAIHRYTGYVDTDPLYLSTKKLSDGQRATMDFSRRADDLFSTWTSDRKFLDEIQGRKAKEIEITGSHDGKPVTVKITPAMRMSLYLHSLNPDNLYHIAHGGVRVPDMKLYKQGKLADAYAAGKLVTLTPSAIRQIVAQMSTKERAFARAAHDYFNGMSQKEINEVSEKLVGYSLAEVENYFPINSDKKYTHSDTLDEFVADSTIQGGGFLKARVKKAGNAIMLRDMNSVLNQSIADTSRYVGLAIPVRNFKKLWNVSTPMLDENGEFVAYGDGVQEAVAQHWGTKGTQYVENLISDIDGNSRKSRSRANKYLNQIRSNYAGAVLTLNLSVAMKQAASYPTAAAVLGWNPLLKAFTRYGAVDTKLIAKYTPLLYYRTKGFSTTELGDIAQSNNWFNRQVASHKWLNWVQAVDLLTTKKLWKAAEIYVEDNYKELKPGTDEFYERVADMYNQTIEETQPNYTTMQRPDILRDDNALLQTVIMFKTQPFQNFNIIYDAIGNWSAKMQQYKANPNEATKEALKAAGKKAKDASSALVMSMLVFAAMTFAYSMLRGGSDKYKDKDGNTTAESIFGGIGKDMASGFAGTVPFGAEAWELIASELFGEKYYGLDSTTITAISDFVDSCKSGFDSILDIINEPEKDRLYWQKKRLDWDKILKNTSKAYGVPYDNVEKLFNIMISKGLNLKGEYSGRYEYLKLTESASYSSNKSDYYDNLYAAYNNDPAQFREIYFDMRDFGFSEEAIKKAIEDRMKEEQGVNSVKDLKNRFVAPKK